jgi:hypothetical protein
MRRRITFMALLLATAGTASAQTQGPQQEAPPSATIAAASESKALPKQTLQPVTGKWSTEFYGFVEFDGMEDSTQSFNDLAGNGKISRPETFAGDHSRSTTSMRNSRLGWKFSSPEFNGMVAKGLIETDFYGNEPGINTISGASEGAFFASPVLRIRHAWLKLENPYVDVLVGQNWQLFGWQPYFHPNTVEVQGVPGQVYSRTPQIRLSHLFKTGVVDVEAAVAASRAVQRDSGVPDGQGGLRILLPGWKGVHTLGGSGTSVDAAAFGVSGVVRKFDLGTPGFVSGTSGPTKADASPTVDFDTIGWGYSLDAFIPLIPVTGSDRSNSLSLNGSFARGNGIADMYTGLNFGLSAITAGSSIDPGLVTQNATGQLNDVESRSYIFGAQYYFPGGGNFWVSANYSRVDFINADYLAPGSKSIFKKSEWADANLFWDVTPAVRFGLEYARFEQTFVDNTKAYNNRWQLSGWYLF